MTAAFPKIGISQLAWVALIPLFFAVKDVEKKGERFRLGFIAGLVHYLSLVFWVVVTMSRYGGLPMYQCVGLLFLLASYLAVYVAVFSVLLPILSPRPLSLLWIGPCLWTCLEYLKTFLFTGFPWELLGYSQYENLPIIQLADLTGVYGVSFLIIFVNTALFLFFLGIGKDRFRNVAVSRSQAGICLGLLGLIFCFAFTYGIWRIGNVEILQANAPKIAVTLVQGNVDQASKWNRTCQTAIIEKYNRLSLSAKNQNPDIVVWPETATPFYFFYNHRLSKEVQKGIRQSGTDFLVGSPFFEKTKTSRKYHNSAFLVNSAGVPLGRYDKTHLVPFGEYVPLKNWLFFAGKMVAQVGDFKPGDLGHTLIWKEYQLGVQICYEVIFPGLTRIITRNGANLIFNITNDAWFGRTGATQQHFSMAIFRAVENKRALVRCANTGVSGFVSPTGRIIESTPLFIEKVMTHEVPLIRKKTIYTRLGDFFAWLCLAGSGLAAINQYIINKKK